MKVRSAPAGLHQKISLTPALPRFGGGCISPKVTLVQQPDSYFGGDVFDDHAFLPESEFLKMHIATGSTTQVGWRNQMFVRYHWPIELKIVSQSSVAPISSSVKNVVSVHVRNRT